MQISCLGITLGTIHVEVHLQSNKLVGVKKDDTSWLGKKNATRREILSLLGLL